MAGSIVQRTDSAANEARRPDVRMEWACDVNPVEEDPPKDHP